MHKRRENMGLYASLEPCHGRERYFVPECFPRLRVWVYGRYKLKPPYRGTVDSGSVKCTRSCAVLSSLGDVRKRWVHDDDKGGVQPHEPFDQISHDTSS